MAINTLITLKDALTTFVAEHEQLKRIEFEADDFRAPKITEGDEFPVLFVAPIGVDIGNAMNMHRIRIYVYERINDDRSDVWENANDTSLMLRDIRVYWNSYSDSDIMILGEPSGEFKCGDELDNLVGYYADFVFEIPSHGRCDVPINVIPDPSITCADANYTVQYEDGTLIESGTIPSGGSVLVEVPNVVICQDANYTLTDSAGNVLDSGTIASGGSAVIVAPDGTNNINKSSGALIQSVSVASGAVVATSIADSVITLQNTAATPLSTTNVLATDSATIVAPDATFTISDSQGNLIESGSIPSGGNEDVNIADSVITVNSASYTSLLSTDSLNVQIVDSNGDAVATTVVGSNVQVDDLPCAPEPSSGISYFEPNRILFDNIAYADFDAKWRIDNNVYFNEPPAKPLYTQQLNFNSADPFNTLLFDNIFANKFRFTDDTGDEITAQVFNSEIYDHLTGRIYILVSEGGVFRNWELSLSLKQSQGYYIPSREEYMSLKDMRVSGVIRINNVTIGVFGGSRFPWTCNTDTNNTGNALRMNNDSLPTVSSDKSNAARSFLYVKLI